MDLKSLRTFVTVVEEGSVSKAALRLRTAQPALSRQIIDLEKKLGIKLFDRIGRRLVLTRDGEQMIENCRDVLGHMARLSERAHLLHGGEVGLLKVAASPQIIESVLAKFLLHYAVVYPRVDVKLTEAVGRDQLIMLERGDVDIAVGMLAAIRSERRFANYQLPGVEILAACHPSHQLASEATIEIAALAQYPLLVLDSSYMFRKSFDEACRFAGFEPNVVIESRGPHTLLALAEAGHGVAIIQTAVPIERYNIQIIRVTHRRKPIRLPMSTIWDSRHALPQYAREFCESLNAYMREVFPISQSGARMARRAATRATVRRKKS